MKKVIEQEEAPNIIVIHKEDEIIVRENVLMQEPVTVEKSKAREVALAICPELGEPTIKTDNTKVILHLESELESMKEERKAIFEQINTGLSPEIYSKTNQIKSLESELEKQNELYKGLKELGHERITKLESELKEAVELIEIYTLQNREGYHSIISNDTYSRSINFLTKYKSKE